jgi:hypothetical protein
MTSWAEADEAHLREAVAAKHAAVERAWCAERALRLALGDGRRDPRALRRLTIDVEAAWTALAARGQEAGYWVARALRARGEPIESGGAE